MATASALARQSALRRETTFLIKMQKVCACVCVCVCVCRRDSCACVLATLAGFFYSGSMHTYFTALTSPIQTWRHVDAEEEHMRWWYWWQPGGVGVTW